MSTHTDERPEADATNRIFFVHEQGCTKVSYLIQCRDREFL